MVLNALFSWFNECWIWFLFSVIIIRSNENRVEEDIQGMPIEYYYLLDSFNKVLISELCLILIFLIVVFMAEIIHEEVASYEKLCW